MLEQLTILAEGASHGVSAPTVGIGTFIILMCLLGIANLTGGMNQRSGRGEKRHED